LSSADLLVDSVRDGPAALQKLLTAREQGKPYLAAVVDWHMPGMNGIELARRIREQAQLADLGLFLLTSDYAKISAEQVRKCGNYGQAAQAGPAAADCRQPASVGSESHTKEAVKAPEFRAGRTQRPHSAGGGQYRQSEGSAHVATEARLPGGCGRKRL